MSRTEELAEDDAAAREQVQEETGRTQEAEMQQSSQLSTYYE